MTVNQMNMLQVGTTPRKVPKRVRLGRETRRAAPSRLIRTAAATLPGGVMRWTEAREIYLRCSESARTDEEVGATHFHLNLQQIFRRYFLKVEGVRGYYVLKTMADGDNEELLELLGVA